MARIESNPWRKGANAHDHLLQRLGEVACANGVRHGVDAPAPLKVEGGRLRDELEASSSDEPER
jgi:hypothetical protein